MTEDERHEREKELDRQLQKFRADWQRVKAAWRRVWEVFSDLDPAMQTLVISILAGLAGLVGLILVYIIRAL